MTSWNDVEAAEPELASRARTCITATTNAVLATLRKDGSPRLSGIDPLLFGGDLYIGSMPGARKGADLRRDPRFALHSVPWESRKTAEDATAVAADAKVAGRAVLVTDVDELRRVMGHHEENTGYEAPPESDLFRMDIEELVVISVDGEELVVDQWSSAAGRRVTRRT